MPSGVKILTATRSGRGKVITAEVQQKRHAAEEQRRQPEQHRAAAEQQE
jgi:hypothetical protein